MIKRARPPKIHIVCSTGNSFSTDAGNAAEYIFNPHFIYFFALMTLVFAILTPPVSSLNLDTLAMILLTGAIFFTSVGGLFVGIWLSAALITIGFLTRIYSIIPIFSMFCFNQILIQYGVLHAVFFDDFSPNFEVVFLVRSVIVFMAFEILHGLYVAPRHPLATVEVGPLSRNMAIEAPKERAGETGAPKPVSHGLLEVVSRQVIDSELPKTFGANVTAEPLDSYRPAKVKIGGEELDASQIMFVASEDHYLRIQLIEKNILVRGRLSETVLLLGETIGIQINRSVWVAFAAIQFIDKKPGGHNVVHLNDGSTFRVAGSRRLVFLTSYDRYQTEGLTDPPRLPHS